METAVYGPDSRGSCQQNRIYSRLVYSRLILVENDFSFFDIGNNPIARNELSFQ